MTPPRLLAAALLSLGLAGCIPARTPPQLAFTPGPPAVVTDRTYANLWFALRYPAGWRVVTGAADAPPSVVFVAPDDASTVTIQVGELDTAGLDDPAFRYAVRRLALAGGLTLTAVVRAPAAAWDAFLPQADALLASIQAR